MYELNSKVERADKLEQFVQFLLFASNIVGNISHRKFRNCWVAKKLISHTFFVKFRLYIGLKFSEITEIVMLFQYSEVLFY